MNNVQSQFTVREYLAFSAPTPPPNGACVEKCLGKIKGGGEGKFLGRRNPSLSQISAFLARIVPTNGQMSQQINIYLAIVPTFIDLSPAAFIAQPPPIKSPLTQ